MRNWDRPGDEISQPRPKILVVWALSNIVQDKWDHSCPPASPSCALPIICETRRQVGHENGMNRPKVNAELERGRPADNVYSAEVGAAKITFYFLPPGCRYLGRMLLDSQCSNGPFPNEATIVSDRGKRLSI